MRKHWLLVCLGLVMAVLAVAAIGCGDDEDDGGSPTPTESITTPVATEATTPAPTGSGTPAGTPAGAPSAFTTVTASENPDLGTILTTFDGLTLYTFDNDTGGVPTCTDACANLWPPLVIPGTPTAGEGVSGTLDVVARDDGSMQVTLDGKPLYLYSSDSAAGDTNGDGINGIWHAVKLGQ